MQSTRITTAAPLLLSVTYGKRAMAQLAYRQHPRDPSRPVLPSKHSHVRTAYRMQYQYLAVAFWRQAASSSDLATPAMSRRASWPHGTWALAPAAAQFLPGVSSGPPLAVMAASSASRLVPLAAAMRPRARSKHSKVILAQPCEVCECEDAAQRVRSGPR